MKGRSAIRVVKMFVRARRAETDLESIRNGNTEGKVVIGSLDSGDNDHTSKIAVRRQPEGNGFTRISCNSYEI